ncbi:MAG: hypothetical protein GXY85_10670 [Candidatus Brocadiaceae bacterium]|nr:hypothetical protein [Candidatus Brocadiaceae bacterium]
MISSGGRAGRENRQDRRLSLELEALESRIMLSNPVIAFLADTPDPVHQGGDLTLTAYNVIDGDGDPITGVQFYRSTDAVLDGGDTNLGAGVQVAAYNWAWTGIADWNTGGWHYFAVATNDIMEASTPAMAVGTVNALPVVGSLSGSPEPVTLGDTLTLTAGGVYDPDGSVTRVDFFRDANGDGVYDGGDLFLGSDTDAAGGWSLSTLVTWTTGGYFARARDNSGGWGDYTYGTVNQKPTVVALTNNPNPAVPGQPVTFTASGVSDPGGSIANVAFYRDVYNSGYYDPGIDILMGYGTDMGGGDWSLTVLVDWDPDISPVYFAIATDNAGAESIPVWTLNQNPHIDDLEPGASPIHLGDEFSLIANGVMDSDGNVEWVTFSVHAPNTYWPYQDSPTDWGSDYNSTGGWRWDMGVVDWEITSQVKADFNADGHVDIAVTVDVTGTGGIDFVSVLFNDGAGNFYTTSVVDLYDPEIGANYNPKDMVVGDFNGDGAPDLALAAFGDPAAGSGHPDYRLAHAVVLLNSGAGYFTSHTDYDVDYNGPADPSPIHPDSLATGDYNGDGFLDLILASSVHSEIPVLVGDGTGAFTLDRIYTYGDYPNYPGDRPAVFQGIQDILSTQIDYESGDDIAMVGPNGPVFLFNWLAEDYIDYFDPGNVIGRAMETGILGGLDVDEAVEYRWAYKTSYRAEPSGPLGTRGDDFYPQWIHDGDVDFYRLRSAGARELTITTTRLAEPGNDADNLYVYVFDSTGSIVGFQEMSGENGDELVVVLGADPDSYYVAVAGQEIDGADPFTAYSIDENEPLDGGNDVEYFLRIELAAGTFDADYATPFGAGTSITAADFMEDDYNRNSNERIDTDLAISNPLTNEVTVLFGDRRLWTRSRVGYAGFFTGLGDADTRSVTYNIGRTPVYILAHNIDADLFRDSPSKPDWDWDQGSSGQYENEYYVDLVTVNTDGTLSILLNNAGDAGELGTWQVYQHEYQDPARRYRPEFDDADLNYWLSNYQLPGPLLNPVAIVAGDFDGDGVQSFVVAEQHNLAFLRSAYPYHHSDPLDLTPYSGEIPQIGLPFEFQSRYSILPGTQRQVTYHATAFDNLWGWPDNLQYEGYSTVVSAIVPLNQRPTVWLLTANREELTGADDVTLTAYGAQDMDGAVAYVEFYRDDGDGVFDAATDTLLGVDINAADGWIWTGPLEDTGDVFWARAFDTDGADSVAVGTMANTRPTIGEVQVSHPVIDEGDYLTLTAVNVVGGANSGNPNIRRVHFYRDINGDGAFNPYVDYFLGTGTNTGGADWEITVRVNWSPGEHTYFAVAQDFYDDWSPTSEVVNTVSNLPPVIDSLADSPDPVTQGDYITLNAVGVDDPYGDVHSVAFYIDSDTSGDVSDGDVLLGVDTSAAGGWRWSGPATWAPGDYQYLALVTDNYEATATATTTGNVNARPVVAALTDVPDPVPQGTELILTATGVTDDGTIEEVVFYRDSNSSGALEVGIDDVLEPSFIKDPVSTGVPGEWWWQGPAEWTVGTHVYFVRARDNDNGWSYAIQTTGRVENARPTIGGLVLNPNPVTQGANLVLTAQNVTDAVPGTVQRVEFYRDVNDNGILDAGVDQLLGTDYTATGNDYSFTLTVNWAPGDHTYFARAQDDLDAWSDAAVVDGLVNGRPAIGSLTADPAQLIPGQMLKLTATDVGDTDGAVATVAFYRDTNGNGTYQEGLDALIGFGTQVAPGTWELEFADPTAVRVFFARAQDDSGGWSAAASVNVPRRPTIAGLTLSPDPVHYAQNLVLTATTVADIDGYVDMVVFYRDANDDGVLNEEEDEVLGIDTSEIGGWSLAILPTWEPGDHTYFARARDNEGYWSDEVNAPSTTGHVDIPPTIGNLTGDPLPIPADDWFTLIAEDVQDDDGTVVEVEFYRDANGNGELDLGVDILLGRDDDPNLGWSWQYKTPTSTMGAQTFLARARDNDGAWSQAVVFYAGPEIPSAPDLQPGSDSGVSDSDDITNAPVLIFNVNSSTNEFRVYRSGTLVGTGTGTTFAAIGEPEGTWDYTVTAWEGGSESEHSDALTVTVDRTAPVVTDGNITAWLSFDDGIIGVADAGDVLTVTWDNSLLGDANTDVASVFVDLSGFGGPDAVAMVDNGTNGDAVAGDGIYTAQLTIDTGVAFSGIESYATPDVAVTVTDIAGNQTTTVDPGSIPVITKLLVLRQWGNVVVAVYDVDGNSNVDPGDIEVRLGNGIEIKSITIGGANSADGLGIAISGASYVKSIKDSRKGFADDLAFIVSDAPIGSIKLNSGIAGYDVNGLTVADVDVPADADADGDTNDAVAVYSESFIGKVQTARGINGDVVITGRDGQGYSLSGLSTKTGGYHGDMVLAGNAGKIQLAGNFGSSLQAGGSVASFESKTGNMLSGSRVNVGGVLSKLRFGGSLLGQAAEADMVQVFARDIGQIDVKGNVQHARILAGADLGADWAIGGTDANADTFGGGSIQKIKIGGNVSSSTIAAGLVAGPGDEFNLNWAETTGAFVDGSVIGKVDIKGWLDGPAPFTGIGAWRVEKFKINGASIHPLVFSEV